MKHLFNLIWTVSVLGCTCAVAAPIADLSGGQTGRIEYESMNPPNRWEYARLNMQNTKQAVVWGDLLMPKNISGKVPALVLSHGSSGISPAAYDVWASHEMVQLIAEAKVFRPALRAAFVINRRVVGTVIGREARAALSDQPFAALYTEVSQRIVFADSVAAGRLACEVAPQCAAAREIAALAQTVREMLR